MAGRSGRVAAVGCRAHTGWAALVVVAGGVAQPEVLLRGRAELGDPAGRVKRNVYQSSRTLEPATAAGLVEAAGRIAAEQAAAALEQVVRQARDEGAVARSCAVVVGALPAGARLESILASHALAHAAEGRLYHRTRCWRAPRRAASKRSRSRSGRCGMRARRRLASRRTS